jgi:hypothetical protein
MDASQLDEKSTPISSLNNKGDDSDVVNNILQKYNNLEQGTNINELEAKFEDRNLNKEIYDISSDNTQYKEHQAREMQRINKQKQVEYEEDLEYDEQNNDPNNDPNNEDEYVEYEIEEQPLWRRILNEIRIPVFIFIFAIVFFNSTFNKILVQKIPLLGNQFNDCNTYGFLIKAFLLSFISYLFIRFVRI